MGWRHLSWWSDLRVEVESGGGEWRVVTLRGTRQTLQHMLWWGSGSRHLLVIGIGPVFVMIVQTRNQLI